MNSPHERELPMLAGIAAILRWFEELLNIVNGPLLLFGAGIALVDLLTDGALTVGIPLLLFAWAISQALGIDTQLLGCFARARSAPTAWARVGWLALGLVLGYAAWQAGYVFAIQQAQHLSEAAALAQLHMDPALWLGWRAFLAVGLVALSGWTRYRAPAKVTTSLEDERAELERELTLEPLRQRLRATQVGGVRALAQTALRGAQAADVAAETPPAPMTVTGFEATEQALTPQQDATQPAPEPAPDASHLSAEDIIERVKRDLYPLLEGYPPTAEEPPAEPTPPTDGGTPSFASKRNTQGGVATQPLADNVTPLRRSGGMGRSPRAPKRDRKVVNRSNARGGKRGNAEQRVRTAIASNPSIGFEDLVKVAKVAPSTASTYLRIIEAERASRREAR